MSHFGDNPTKRDGQWWYRAKRRGASMEFRIRPKTAQSNTAIMHAIRTGYHVPAQTQKNLKDTIDLENTVLKRSRPKTTPHGHRIRANHSVRNKFVALNKYDTAKPVVRPPTVTPRRWHPRSSPRMKRCPVSATQTGRSPQDFNRRPATTAGKGYRLSIETPAQNVPGRKLSFDAGWDSPPSPVHSRKSSGVQDIISYTKSERDRQKIIASSHEMIVGKDRIAAESQLNKPELTHSGDESSSSEDGSEEDDESYDLLKGNAANLRSQKC